MTENGLAGFIAAIFLGVVVIASLVSCQRITAACADHGMEAKYFWRGNMLCVGPNGQVFDPSKF